jgi:hypothetical protein
MTENPSADPASSPPPCPKCQGEMWDNRVGKKNPKAPDFKCKDKGCDGVIWPPREATKSATPVAEHGSSATSGLPTCPICGGPMWDDRLSKRNPKAPDFKCKNKPKERGDPGCEGVIWPPRSGAPSPYPAPAPRAPARSATSAPPFDGAPHPHEPPPYNDAPPHDDDDLPF